MFSLFGHGMGLYVCMRLVKRSLRSGEACLCMRVIQGIVGCIRDLFEKILRSRGHVDRVEIEERQVYEMYYSERDSIKIFWTMSSLI